MAFYDTLAKVLGLDVEPKNLGYLEVCLRAVIVFIAAVIMVRVADRRFLSKMTAFDIILGFVLSSALARAINGSAPFFPTLVMGFVLVGLHRTMAKLALYSKWFGTLVKGRVDFLIRDGTKNDRAIRANNITEHDLVEAARQHAKVEDLEKVKTAVLERSGQISIIPRG